MIYITGDKHADFKGVFYFCKANKTTIDDILIILGDAGINYYANELDDILKNSLLQCPITFFCIHGNHEERPENIKTYKTKKFHDGVVYYEEKYPNILFAKDGEIYSFNNYKVLVIGGAYSVDKQFRITYGYNWYESEQPTEETKNRVRKVLKNLDGEHYVFKVKNKEYFKWLNRKISKYEYRRVKHFLNGTSFKDTTIKALEYIMKKEEWNYYEIYDIKKVIKEIKRKYKKEEHFVYKYIRDLRFFF